MSNKKVLFIGPYRQTDGWGEAAKDYVRCLETLDIDLTIKPIYMSVAFKKTTLPFEHWSVLEQKKHKSYDFIIQNVLPNLMEYNGPAKNIGLSYFETSNLKNSAWIRKLNIMDEIWTASKFEHYTLKQAGVKQARYLGMPIDTAKYSEQTSLNIPDLQNSFLFYYIGEYNTRKNLEALLIAFYREFHRRENTKLVIKTNKLGMDKDEITKTITDLINNVKKKLRLYFKLDEYPDCITICHRLTDSDLLKLHNTCNCFVLPSSGEAFARPAFDALALGKTPIVNKNSGMATFVTPNNGFLVESRETPIYINDPPFMNFYTGAESWYEINIIDLQKKMRAAYNLSNKTRNRMIENSKRTVKNFSYENIGKKIMESFNALSS
jgi:glycosyltransferase involved in cell wall biosynthesis